MSTKKNTVIEEVPFQAKTRVPKDRGKVGTLVRKVKSPGDESTSVLKKIDCRGATSKYAQASVVACDLLNDLGNLPHSYGEEVMFLVAQYPHWLFTYWDIDISRHPGGPCILRVEEASGVLEQEVEVSFETRNWYIPVKKAGGSYAVEIGFHRHGKWNPISRSPIATTPRDKFSESTAFDFATVPMHISFQRLVENLSHSFASSEELLPALIKLQQTIPLNLSSGFPLEARDREILQELLGSDILAGISSGQWNSEELHSAISQRLRESLSSAEVEEFFSRLPQWNSESVLFSGFQKLVAELAGSSSFMGSAAFVELLSRLESLQAQGSLFSGFQKLSAELAASSSLMGSSDFAGLLTRLQHLQAESSLFSQFQKLSTEISSSSSQLGSAAFTEIFAINLSSWLTGLITSWGGGEASETLAQMSAPTSWSGVELSSASEFAARAALSSWLAESDSSRKGTEVSMQALAAISSWSSEIMASQGFAASSWSASKN
jgi:hypothetical protein